MPAPPPAQVPHHHVRAMRAAAAALLLLSLAAAAGHASAALGLGSSLIPDNIFYRQLGQDEVAVFAPGVQFAGQALRNATTSSAEACAQLCSKGGDCDLFNFVGGGVQVGSQRRSRPTPAPPTPTEGPFCC